MNSTRLLLSLKSHIDAVTQAKSEDLTEAVQALKDGFAGQTQSWLEPDALYRATRPYSWPGLGKLPDDQIRLLCARQPGCSGVFTAMIIHTGRCLVELGTMQNGSFTVLRSLEPVSGTRFYLSAEADGDFCAVRITGDVTAANFALDEQAVRQDACSILEAVSTMEADLVFGNNSHHGFAQRQMRYMRFLSKGAFQSSAAAAFANCSCLMLVSAQAQAKSINHAYMFQGCRNLLTVSPQLLSDGSYRGTFYLSGLTQLPPASFAATYADSMFGGTKTPVVDGKLVNTAAVKNFASFLYSARTLYAWDIDISAMTAASQAFADSELLGLTFAGESTPGGVTLDLSTTKLSHRALLELISSLPPAKKAASITITDTPGAAALTDEQIAAATAKNWSIIM